MTRLPQNTQPLSIETNSVWSSGGLGFQNPEPWEVSESAQTFEFAVQSRLEGQKYNLPANSPWSPIPPGWQLSNPQAFVGGQNKTAATPGLYPDSTKLGPQDDLLESHLAVGKNQLLDMIGKKDFAFPEADQRAVEGVFLLSAWRLQQNNFLERSYPVPSLQSASPETKNFWRGERAYKSLLSQVSGLISHLKDYGRHIKGDSDAA